ncbi:MULTISPECIES: DUF922 domain-containing protein [Hymenobacter]|uniref:DUF922 domain-containing protein n=1 Tax=Hymenobacter jejuensis TaxID=2502781 RepID=A0A5B8A579_9BACT|nr:MULTISPECIES: DUF922 domain-containing protein [Hymenobacter]MBC6989328.1 DUF922 domain-containing protein [Hymenobacter sp. BT491]QDA61362.1 DUF922 domain-containing protein [Hymenobacter jejuensis]
MPVFSFLLPLLFWLPMASTPAPQNTVVAADPATLIPWSPTRPLAWSDFKSKPTPADKLAALTTATIDVKAGCTDFVFNYSVRAVFSPTESWVREATKSNESLLKHEQLHFDITEYHARKLRQKLSTLHLNCAHLQPGFKNVTNAAFAEWQRDEARYDAETNHGLNTPNQKNWEGQIKLKLAQLDRFAVAP